MYNNSITNACCEDSHEWYKAYSGIWCSFCGKHATKKDLDKMEIDKCVCDPDSPNCSCGWCRSVDRCKGCVEYSSKSRKLIGSFEAKSVLRYGDGKGWCGGNTITVHTDGVLLSFEHKAPFTAFKLEKNKIYRVTVEEIVIKQPIKEKEYNVMTWLEKYSNTK